MRRAIRPEIMATQLNDVARSIPIFVIFQLSAAGTVISLLMPSQPSFEIALWLGAVVVCSVILILAVNKPSKNFEQIYKFSPIFGIVSASIWSILPVQFIQHLTHDEVLLGLGVTLTVQVVGTISLLRLPLAASVFSAIMSAATIYSITHILSTHRLAGMVICTVFGLTLIFGIMVQHRLYLEQFESKLKLKTQAEVIKLLLNDFERDTSDWLWETDPNAVLTYHSPRLAQVLRQNSDDLNGSDFLAAIRPHTTTPDRPSLSDLMAAKQIIAEQVYKIEIQGQTQFWQISARPIYDPVGTFTGYRGVGRDISKQWHHDHDLSLAKDNAEAANAAKSQFLATISHELRTPINAIVGFSEIMISGQSESLPTTTRRDYLNTILESAKHLQGLINDILDATRIERNTMQIFDQMIDASELVETAVKICRDQAEKSQISIKALLIENIQISGDLTRLKQVILNILTNAIKFSPKSGLIKIEMFRNVEQQLIISIRDQGIGLEPRDIERVFEPFAQVDEGSTRQFGGMGLGLAIARKIARLHGGDVILVSQPRLGTDARLILPSSRIRWPKIAPRPESKATSKVAA